MNNTYIAHSRTKGSKNGVRLYQNKDGSLTPLGREHYGIGPPRSTLKTTISKWATRRKEKAEQKREAAKPLDTSKMSTDDIRKAIERLKLEEELKNLTTKTKTSSFRREFLDLGKQVVKDSLKDAMKTKLTDFIKNNLGTPDLGTVRASKEYKFWKEHDFSAKYAPGSVKNPFSKAAIDEANRVDKVAAQKKDRTLDTSKADQQYWKKQNEREDRAAAKATVAKRDAYEAAQKKAQIAQEAYDRDKNTSTKSALDKANVSATVAKKEFDDSYADLTYEQRNLVRSTYESDVEKQKKK